MSKLQSIVDTALLDPIGSRVQPHGAAVVLESAYANATMMNAVGMTDFPVIGKVADRLEMLQVAIPRPGNKEVAIKLAASSMHIDEIYAAQGTALGRFYGPKVLSKSEPHILGSSVSGIIVAVGKDVEQFEIGDEVIAIPNEQMEIGSWATYRCINEKWVMAKPPALSHVEAAAITMAACVAWGAIGFANVDAGSHCVVVGASGAIGSMVLQYLKSLGCQVTAVCSQENDKFVRELGADNTVDYNSENFADIANTQNLQYDAVIDCVGGLEIEHSAFRSLKTSGVFVTVVGPMKYIGEKKLSWVAFLRVIAHILWRVVATRVAGGPRYTFGAKYPRLAIGGAMEQLLKYNIRMPVLQTIRFEIAEIAGAVRDLQAHRTKGRIVIDFNLQ